MKTNNSIGYCQIKGRQPRSPGDEIALAGEFLTFYEELLPKNSKKYKSLFYIIIRSYPASSNDDLNIFGLEKGDFLARKP